MASIAGIHIGTFELDEADFIRIVGTTIKLSIRFDGWTRPGRPYFHPFTRRSPLNPNDLGSSVSLHHLWLQGGEPEDRTPFHKFSLEAAAAGLRTFDGSRLS